MFCKTKYYHVIKVIKKSLNNLYSLIHLFEPYAIHNTIKQPPAVFQAIKENVQMFRLYLICTTGNYRGSPFTADLLHFNCNSELYLIQQICSCTTKTPVPYKTQFNAQLYYIVVLHNAQFRSAVTHLYDLRFMQYIFS